MKGSKGQKLNPRLWTYFVNMDSFSHLGLAWRIQTPPMKTMGVVRTCHRSILSRPVTTSIGLTFGGGLLMI